MQDAISIGNRMIDGFCVVILAVPDCSKSHHVTHSAKLGEAKLSCQYSDENNQGLILQLNQETANTEKATLAP